MRSQKITLYLAGGLPRGTRSASIDQWSGKVVAGPRNESDEVIALFEKSGGGSCVYFLIGKSEDGGLPHAYVGESDQIAERIKQHDRKKEWWEDIVIFFAPDRSLTTVGTKYLEAICIERLQNTGRCILENSASPSRRPIPHEDIDGLEYFFDNVVTLLPLFGYEIFVGQSKDKDVEVEQVLFLSRKGVNAKAVLREDGQLKVFRDSTAVAEATSSFSEHAYKSLRDDLIKIGKLIKEGEFLKFTDDYTFNSPSAAGAVILGNAANGKIEWKDKTGKTLKEILEK